MATTSLPLAVIDGKLCRLRRNGSVASAHAPLATAVLEFRQAPLRLYVREHPYGLLPGVSNLYCLDPEFRLLWIAEWPFADDPCGRLVDEAEGVLLVDSVAGTAVRIDATTGRVLACATQMAAAS